jgi:hypothetical protein
MTKWQIRQREIAPPLVNVIPDRHKKYEPDMEEVTTLEYQLNSIKNSGFHRPYTPYTPSSDMESR